MVRQGQALAAPIMRPRKVHPTHCRLDNRSYPLSLGLWEEWDPKVMLEGRVHLQDRVILSRQVWS